MKSKAIQINRQERRAIEATAKFCPRCYFTLRCRRRISSALSAVAKRDMDRAIRMMELAEQDIEQTLFGRGKCGHGGRRR